MKRAFEAGPELQALLTYHEKEDDLPFVTAICPTFRRPSGVVENSVAMWELQDYPAHRRLLYIVDDGGTYTGGSSSDYALTWVVDSMLARAESLPEKFNRGWQATRNHTDIYVVWEDDDMYFPRFISAHALALTSKTSPAKPEYSKPPTVLVDCNSAAPGRLFVERADGKFHSSVAFRKELLERLEYPGICPGQVGGWPDTKRMAFDFYLLGALAKQSRTGITPTWPASHNPDDNHFCYRWSTSNVIHASGISRGPDDETWWDRMAEMRPESEERIELIPKFDDFTLTCLYQRNELSAR